MVHMIMILSILTGLVSLGACLAGKKKGKTIFARIMLIFTLLLLAIQGILVAAVVWWAWIFAIVSLVAMAGLFKKVNIPYNNTLIAIAIIGSHAAHTVQDFFPQIMG